MFKPLTNFPRKVLGASLVELALVMTPLILLILLIVLGGIAIFQISIVDLAAEQALVPASRIDRNIRVIANGANTRGIPLNAQVVCKGTVSGRPDCMCVDSNICGVDRRVLSAGRFDQIFDAARSIVPSVSRENIDVIYGRYDQGISVSVQVSIPSIWSGMNGQNIEAVGKAYAFVISKSF